MDGREILGALGVTERGVKGAIKGLLDASPQLKETVREIVATNPEYQYRAVGQVNGETVYARDERF